MRLNQSIYCAGGKRKPYTAYEPYEEGFTIIGYGGTEAERYAEDTPGITFVDLDGNSKNL